MDGGGFFYFMANYELNNSEVVRAVLQTAGLSRTGTLDAATEADVRQIIRSGLRRALWPTNKEFAYQWRWLEKTASFPVPALYTTGTITVSAGTITLAGSTWPSWVLDGFISVGGHILFIDTSPATTTATTTNTQLEIAAGTSYTLYRYRYDLPSDFGEWLGGVVYANGNYTRQLAGSSEPEIRLRYAVGQGLTQHTTHFAVTNTPDAGTQRIIFWPVPEPDAFIQGVYLSTPDDNLPADLNTPGVVVQCPPIYAEMFLQSILSAAETYYMDAAGVHEAMYQEALIRCMAHDRAVGGSYDFSYRAGDGRDDYRGHGVVLPITFG